MYMKTAESFFDTADNMALLKVRVRVFCTFLALGRTALLKVRVRVLCAFLNFAELMSLKASG